MPADNRVQFVFKPIGKFIASYRNGRWDDKKATVEKFSPEQISEKIQEFGHLPIYGWEFIDNKDSRLDKWKDKLSFNFEAEDGQGLSHTIGLFQDGTNKTIEMKIWFDEIELYNSKYEKITLQDFIENGQRGWSGNNPEKFGIFPIKGSSNGNS